MLHARTLRQPNRGATLAALDEAAIRRAAKGELQIVREANFVAFVSPVESVAQAPPRPRRRTPSGTTRAASSRRSRKRHG